MVKSLIKVKKRYIRQSTNYVAVAYDTDEYRFSLCYWLTKQFFIVYDSMKPGRTAEGS